MRRKNKINVTVSESIMSKVERIKKRLRGASNAEVVRRAVGLLDAITGYTVKGDQLLIKGKGNEQYIRLVFPELEALENEE